VTLGGSVIDSKRLQPSKACGSIEVTLGGITTDFNGVCTKVASLMEVMFSGSDTDCKFRQYAKAHSSIVTTLEGISTEDMRVQK